jgi:chemotaxis protein MotB
MRAHTLSHALRACLFAAAITSTAACVPASQYGAEVQLANARQQLIQQLQQELATDRAEITTLQNELKVTLRQELLFPEGGWRLSPAGEATLRKIAPTLASTPGVQIVVNGYTDNLPILPQYRGQFPSNWELSSYRSGAVVRTLQEQGVDPGLMRAVGFGDTRPVASNDTAEGRARNRRVDITLVGGGN